jgi:hypothetical protein
VDFARDHDDRRISQSYNGEHRPASYGGGHRQGRWHDRTGHGNLARHRSPSRARPAWRRAGARSRGATVQRADCHGDTSTNDSLFLLASGAAGNAAISTDGAARRALARAVGEVAGEIARLVAADGEGGTRVVTIEVRGAASDREAAKVLVRWLIGRLFEEPLAGADPNWGRIACAVGYSDVRLDPEKVSIRTATSRSSVPVRNPGGDRRRACGDEPTRVHGGHRDRQGARYGPSADDGPVEGLRRPEPAYST